MSYEIFFAPIRRKTIFIAKEENFLGLEKIRLILPKIVMYNNFMIH